MDSLVVPPPSLYLIMLDLPTPALQVGLQGRASRQGSSPAPGTGPAIPGRGPSSPQQPPMPAVAAAPPAPVMAAMAPQPQLQPSTPPAPNTQKQTQSQEERDQMKAELQDRPPPEAGAQVGGWD
jgi:hypothetical protein